MPPHCPVDCPRKHVFQNLGVARKRCGNVRPFPRRNARVPRNRDQAVPDRIIVGRCDGQVIGRHDRQPRRGERACVPSPFIEVTCDDFPTVTGDQTLHLPRVEPSTVCRFVEPDDALPPPSCDPCEMARPVAGVLGHHQDFRVPGRDVPR